MIESSALQRRKGWPGCNTINNIPFIRIMWRDAVLDWEENFGHGGSSITLAGSISAADHSLQIAFRLQGLSPLFVWKSHQPRPAARAPRYRSTWCNFALTRMRNSSASASGTCMIIGACVSRSATANYNRWLKSAVAARFQFNGRGYHVTWATNLLYYSRVSFPDSTSLEVGSGDETTKNSPYIYRGTMPLNSR